MTLRIISLDLRSADPRVESATFASAATLLDFDVAIWNPANILAHYWKPGGPLYEGLPALSEASSFAMQRDFARRKKELDKFLELGRTLVVFVPPPDPWFVDTGEKTYSGTGKNRSTTRMVTQMGLSAALPFELATTVAAGTAMRAVGTGSFQEFWRSTSDLFAYQAYLDNEIGTPAAVIDRTDLAVAAVGRVNGGTLILLPALDFDEAPTEEVIDQWEEEADDDPDVIEFRAWLEARAEAEQTLIDALIPLVQDLATPASKLEQPQWASSFLLPNEAESTNELADLEDQVRHLLERVDDLKVDVARVARRKTLFTGSGPVLETLVGEVFEELGCAVEPGEPGRTDRVVKRGSDVLVLEVKGKGKSAAEADAAQLEKWVNARHLETGSAPKGVLVVNAWRGRPLPERTADAFPHQMLAYSEARGHCLITGLQLLGAWHDATAHPSKKLKIFRSIRDCTGIYPGYLDWRKYVSEAESSELAEA